MHRTANMLFVWPTASAPPTGGADGTRSVDASGRFPASG
jgi:hypothetical protein